LLFSHATHTKLNTRSPEGISPFSFPAQIDDNTSAPRAVSNPCGRVRCGADFAK
jgi:hypothetical protein